MYDFLASLKPESDRVRNGVLGKEPFPCFSEVYSYVRSQESKRSVMLAPAFVPKIFLFTCSTKPNLWVKKSAIGALY